MYLPALVRTRMLGDNGLERSVALSHLKARMRQQWAKLAIEQFIPCRSLSEIIGKRVRVEFAGQQTDLIPLPHPSGASPWPRVEPGRSLLRKAIRLISRHPALERSDR